MASQRTGDRNDRSGIYRCNACDYVIVRYKGERFPPCPRHNASASVGWTLVRPIKGTTRPLRP